MRSETAEGGLSHGSWSRKKDLDAAEVTPKGEKGTDRAPISALQTAF